MAFDREIDAESRDLIVLRRARDRIARGWCRGDAKRSESVCMGGAYAVVSGLAVSSDMEFHTPAMNHFAELLGFEGDLDAKCPHRASDRMVQWNDQEGRTKAEVLARFDAAIARLEGRG